MTNLEAFVVSGNDDKIHKLKALIEKRQLSNEDLALMLRTVKAREESKQWLHSTTLRCQMRKAQYIFHAGWETASVIF